MTLSWISRSKFVLGTIVKVISISNRNIIKRKYIEVCGALLSMTIMMVFSMMV